MLNLRPDNHNVNYPRGSFFRFGFCFQGLWFRVDVAWFIIGA